MECQKKKKDITIKVFLEFTTTKNIFKIVSISLQNQSTIHVQPAK